MPAGKKTQQYRFESITHAVLMKLKVFCDLLQKAKAQGFLLTPLSQLLLCNWSCPLAKKTVVFLVCLFV